MKKKAKKNSARETKDKKYRKCMEIDMGIRIQRTFVVILVAMVLI